MSRNRKRKARPRRSPTSSRRRRRRSASTTWNRSRSTRRRTTASSSTPPFGSWSTTIRGSRCSSSWTGRPAASWTENARPSRFGEPRKTLGVPSIPLNTYVRNILRRTPGEKRTMPDIRDRVEQDRGLLKKIQLVIPGYAGYRRREDIRAADNLLRIQLANQLKGVRGDLEDIRDQWAMDGKIQDLQGIGNVIFTLEGLEAKVRHAEGGYSGLSATIQIKETELDRLYEYDYAMLESLDKAASVVPMVREASDPKSLDAALKACREAIAAFETAWKTRTLAVTGIQVR